LEFGYLFQPPKAHSYMAIPSQGKCMGAEGEINRIRDSSTQWNCRYI